MNEYSDNSELILLSDYFMTTRIVLKYNLESSEC